MSRPHSISRRAAGFTLIELLAVVAIVGTLSAIALQQMSVYRRTAVDTQMQSDLHHARIAMEDYYEKNVYSYEDVTVAILESNHGLRLTLSMDLDILNPTATAYGLRACMPNGTVLSYKYETTNGAIIGENVPCT